MLDEAVLWTKHSGVATPVPVPGHRDHRPMITNGIDQLSLPLLDRSCALLRIRG